MATSLTDFGTLLTLTLARTVGRQYTITTTHADGVTAQDMTGATLVFEVRPAIDSGGLLLQKSITYADLTTGIGILTISRADIASTLTFKSGVAYPFSLILTLPGQDPSLQLSGTLTVFGIA